MTPQSPVSVLGEDESWQLLSSVTLGRLVATIGTRLEIFPVNFVVQHRTVLFRTAEGTKLISTLFNDRVMFEADDHTGRRVECDRAGCTAAPRDTGGDRRGRARPAVVVDRHHETALRANPAERDLRAPVRVRWTAGGRVAAQTQYGTRARYWRMANAANVHPIAVSTSTTTQCRTS